MDNINFNKKIYILFVAMALLAGVFFLFGLFRQKEISFFNNYKDEPTNQSLASLRGEGCENAKTRPIAVMLASDPAARPLSGISQADIVIEMPVTPTGITRMMALFQCNQPAEIGSVRSAREDFLPLAASFKAIYAHWGGERGALERLDGGILDNLDALKNNFDEYFRKRGVKAPHNGFTSYELLENAAKKSNYSLNDSFSGYPRKSGGEKKNISQLVSEVNVDYELPYNVLWKYDDSDNSYKRFRGGLPEIDKINNNQVEIKNLIILDIKANAIDYQYIKSDIIGTGEGRVYKNGIVKNIRWEKKDFSAKLYFYDDSEKEIEFEPGSIWIDYVTK